MSSLKIIFFMMLFSEKIYSCACCSINVGFQELLSIQNSKYFSVGEGNEMAGIEKYTYLNSKTEIVLVCDNLGGVIDIPDKSISKKKLLIKDKLLDTNNRCLLPTGELASFYPFCAVEFKTTSSCFKINKGTYLSLYSYDSSSVKAKETGCGGSTTTAWKVKHAKPYNLSEEEKFTHVTCKSSLVMVYGNDLHTYPVGMNEKSFIYLVEYYELGKREKKIKLIHQDLETDKIRVLGEDVTKDYSSACLNLSDEVFKSYNNHSPLNRDLEFIYYPFRQLSTSKYRYSVRIDKKIKTVDIYLVRVSLDEYNQEIGSEKKITTIELSNKIQVKGAYRIKKANRIAVLIESNSIVKGREHSEINIVGANLIVGFKK